MHEQSTLSSRERQVMDVVYREGEVTARDLEQALPDRLANATVRTLLRILEEKGHLIHREEGRQFVYRPVRPKDEEAATALGRLVQVFYNDSITAAVSGLLEMEGKRVDESALDELGEMIDAARRRQRKQRKVKS